MVHGIIKINGKYVDVIVGIKDAQIVICVSENADLTNWYHAVEIRRMIK